MLKTTSKNRALDRFRNLLKIVMLASPVCGLVLNRIANVLAPDETVWRWHDVTMTFTVFALSAVLLSMIPYERLRLKCVVAGLCGSAFVELVWLIPFNPEYWGYGYIAQAVSGLMLASFYYFRSYKTPSVEVKQGFVYCLRTIPRKPQDFIISLFGLFGPDGAYQIYANGTVWRFKNGVLVEEKLDQVPDGIFHVLRGGRATRDILDTLRAKTGTRWSWRENCVFTLGKIWRQSCG